MKSSKGQKREFEEYLRLGEKFLKNAETLLDSEEDSLTGIPELCFHAVESVAKGLLLKKTGRDPGGHGVAIAQFEENFIKTGVLKARMLSAYNRMQEQRNSTTYQFSEIDKVNAKELVDDTTDFFESSKDYARRKGWLYGA